MPVGLLNFIIGVLDVLGKISSKAADKAELARIGRYYVTESMLVWNADLNRYDADGTPSHGQQTLLDAYAAWLGGQVAPERREYAVF